MAAKKKTVKQIVKAQFPGSEVMELTDMVRPMTRKLDAGIRKSPSLKELQKKLGRSAPLDNADSVSTRVALSVPDRKLKAKTEGCSGVGLISPKNTDGTSRRKNTKAVIVSGGRVIAIQG